MGQTRTFWVRLVLPEAVPSDAIRVEMEVEDKAVLDLKDKILSQVASDLPQAYSVPWITLSLPPPSSDSLASHSSHTSTLDDVSLSSPSSTAVEPDHLLLDSSTAITDLPEDAGTSKRKIIVKFPAKESSGAKAVSKGLTKDPNRPRTLFERGIAGRNEHIQIKNALDFSDIYPGGKVPKGSKNEVTCTVLFKLLAAMLILVCFFVGITYVLELTEDYVTKIPGRTDL